MQEDQNLGFKWTHTDRFAFLRREHLKKVAPRRTRVMADFELISHTYSRDTVARIDLKDVDLSAAKECQHCNTKFGFFDKKFACGICKRVVCVTDSRLQQLMPPATASFTICRRCNAYIAFHFHQAELKRKLADAQNNMALIFYTTLMAIKDDVVHELPNFRGIVFTLSSIFGETPQQQEKIREMVDDGGPLLFPGLTLEELFTQGLASQKRLKSVFSALEERLASIQAASNDTKTQQRMIANLKQAMHDFLQHSLPLFRFSAQRLLEIRDHPKTKRLLILAKEQIRQEEINAARRIQEEADRKRYHALVGDDSAPPAFAPGAGAHLSSGLGTHAPQPSSKSKQGSNANGSILSAAWNSISKPLDHLNSSHYVPEIAGIIPAICPSMGGLPLSIKGFNFHPNARVSIASKWLEEWQVLWKSSQELTVISPQSDYEGPVDVIVENPNQSTVGILEDVLFYTNDAAIMETIFGTAALDMNKPASSSKPITTPKPTINPSSQPTNAFSRTEPTPAQPPGFAAAVSHQPPTYAEAPSYIASSTFNRASTSPPSYQAVHYSLPAGYSSTPFTAPSSSSAGPITIERPPSGKTQIRARSFGKEPRVITLDSSNDGLNWNGSPAK